MYCLHFLIDTIPLMRSKIISTYAMTPDLEETLCYTSKDVFVEIYSSIKMYPGTAEFGFLIHIGLQIIYVVKRMTNVDDRLFCNVDFSCL